MKWVALFSRSGSELASLTSTLGTCPDMTITTNHNHDTWSEAIHLLPRVAIMKSKDIHNMLDNRNERLLITMHGYLRILPPAVCSKHFVFNGHPGDIIKYPELKGKDPQKKAIELKLISTGYVIHRATEELDGGDIYRFTRVDITSDTTEDALCNYLRDVGVRLWTDFMTDVLWDLRHTRGGI